mmetsp:Transcript_54716/g.138178  ORF Transcript_54716/g.138178 Transcript_54716/m.138178 type:complete len:210 (-) Transcript_54716:830-1459(-)
MPSSTMPSSSSSPVTSPSSPEPFFIKLRVPTPLAMPVSFCILSRSLAACSFNFASRSSRSFSLSSARPFCRSSSLAASRSAFLLRRSLASSFSLAACSASSSAFLASSSAFKRSSSSFCFFSSSLFFFRSAFDCFLFSSSVNSLSPDSCFSRSVFNFLRCFLLFVALPFALLSSASAPVSCASASDTSGSPLSFFFGVPSRFIGPLSSC